MESFEHTGIWWLPDDPENSLNGTLSFDPTVGGELELIGDSFGDINLRPQKRVPIILGVIHQKLITIHNSVVIFMRSTNPGFEEIKLRIGSIFKGHHFEKVEDIVFRNLSVSYSYLDDWMNQNNFVKNGNYKVSYKPFETVVVELEDATIKVGYDFYRNSTLNSFTFHNTAKISVTPNNESNFNSYLQLIDLHIPNFLSLATGEVVYPISISGQTSATIASIEIFYPMQGYANQARSITRWHMLFTYDDILKEFPIILSNWVKKSEQLASVYDLYFKLYYQKSMDIKTKFLLLAQAFESYHRESYGGTYLTPEEYESIATILIEAIPETVTKSHREKLKGMINYGYEFSLRKRLRAICADILTDHTEIIDIFFGNAKNFANKVTDTRNNLTHHPKTPPKNALLEEEIYAYVDKMQLLFQVCFLVELGLPTDKIRQLIVSTQRFQTWLGSDYHSSYITFN